MSLQLSPDQETAVRNFGEWYRGLGFTTPYWGDAPDYTQEGFAGTGKTTILPFMIEAAGLDPMQVAFVAPTGKAAKVMTKKLRAQGIRETAVTIHKRIYRPKGMKAIQLEGEAEKLRLQRAQAVTQGEKAEIDKKLHIVSRDLERAYHSDAPIFQVNPDADIKEAQLIVVDECSMVGDGVAADLRSFGVPILAIGDPGQLQPVGDKPGFLCREPDHRLTNIHRQALDNPIIWASREIREGRMLNYGEHGDGLLSIVTRSKDTKTFDLQLDAQIIVGTNQLRWDITRKIRNLAGLGGSGPVEGEMMICVKNSQKHAELVNGTMLMVESDTGMLNSGDATCKLFVADEDQNAFELFGIQAYLEENYLGKGNATIPSAQLFHAKQDQRYHHIDWAYAITAHKSQGSQWGEVVVHDQSRVFKEQARQWLYTAVTRAAEKLTIVM